MYFIPWKFVLQTLNIPYVQVKNDKTLNGFIIMQRKYLACLILQIEITFKIVHVLIYNAPIYILAYFCHFSLYHQDH